MAKNHIKEEKQEVKKVNQDLTGRPNNMGIPKFKFKENWLWNQQDWVVNLVM